MKLRLVVQTDGNNKGKVLDITLAQFVIGRDPQCHLRPSSPLISKRHCALVKRDGKAFIQDFDSTNGTFRNDEAVKGEVELVDGDVLKIGPLTFRVTIVEDVPVNKPTPVPPAKSSAAELSLTESWFAAPAVIKPKKPAGPSNDDEIAALLLGDDTDTGGPVAQEKVPDGSTVMDLAAMQAKEAAAKEAEGKTGEGGKPEEKKAKAPSAGDTRSAAESILKKYMKRPRK